MKPMEKESLCVLALSGGVDSSYAAHVLKERFGRLVGASHYIWPDSRCCNVETIGKARAICENLGIPYYLLNMEEVFQTGVVKDYIDTYISGRTPNPCVRCNERMRFTRFYEQIKRRLLDDGLIKEGEPIFFATGHYARIEIRDGLVFLRRGADKSKDQAYMLYRVPRDILKNCVFPLGDLHKRDVIEQCRNIGIVEPKEVSVSESQEACFIEEDYTDFLKSGEAERIAGGIPELDLPGDILDSSGSFLGKHRGYINYTIGQRKGLGLGSGPWYVTRIDPDKNRIYVGRKEELGKKVFFAEETVWFIGPQKEVSCTVQVRYGSREIPARVRPQGNGAAEVELDFPATVSPGQSAVFYQEDIIIGGGIIAGGQ